VFFSASKSTKTGTEPDSSELKKNRQADPESSTESSSSAEEETTPVKGTGFFQ
jgi:hypothetical protein